MKRSTRPALLVRALALLDVCLVGVFGGLLLRDFLRHGTAWMNTEQGALSTWAILAGFLILPALLLAWLAMGLARFDRAAWVLRVGLGLLTVPLFGVGLLALGVLLPRSSRWLFGIGPDAVLAEIDAREEVTVEALARGFGVAPGVIEALLERTIARGAFLGAWDRERGVLYSVDTVLTRENLQRCPHCGGAIQALGNLAHCPHCSTAFAHLTGLDFPLPAPVGLAVIGALDHLLSYLLAVLALAWGFILLNMGTRVASLKLALLAWAVCGALPLALSAAYLWVGRRLEEGGRGAWAAQGVLLPLALPYLLRRRVRVLFASGLEPLRARLQESGRLEMKELASLLRMKPRHADELAIYLTATGKLDSVLDWRTRSLVRRELLDTDGRERCQQCGAPLRVGGWCAFCGTSASRAPRRAPERTRPPAPSERRRRALGPLALKVCTGVVALLAGVHLMRVPSRAPRTLPEERLALRFEPARGDGPQPKETFLGTGILFLGFTDGGRRLLSGEQNGLFVWDVETRQRTLRTPEGWKQAGVHWVGMPPGSEDFFALPYYPAVLQGTTRDWTLERQVDLQALSRELDEALPTTGVVDARGHVLLALRPKTALHLFDLQEGRLLHTLVRDVGQVTQVAFDRAGTRVALAQPFSSVKASVWDVTTGQRLFYWRPEDPPPPGGFPVHLSGVGLSPDGQRLVTVDLGELDFWDVKTGAHLGNVPGASASELVVFEPEARLLAVSTRGVGRDRRHSGVKVFRGDGSGPVYTFEGHETRVTALAFNDEGTLLVSGDAAGVVRFHPLDGLRQP